MEVEKTVVLNQKKFLVTEMLGSGTFGQVYLCKDIKTCKKCAVKVEVVSAETTGFLKLEYEFYKMLGTSGDGIPAIHFFQTKNSYNYLVMDLLGPSINNLFKLLGRSLSLKTVLMLASQMLDVIEYVHDKGIIHQDIKPDNFTMGPIAADPHQVFMVDFGLARLYLNKSGSHLPPQKATRIVGTNLFTSLASHNFITKSRRDDIESFLYTLIFLHKGTLPWEYLDTAEITKKQIQMVGKVKKNSLRELCKGLPSEFKELLVYTRNLKYDEKPNYEHIAKLLENAFYKIHVNKDNFDFDWQDKSLYRD